MNICNRNMQFLKICNLKKNDKRARGLLGNCNYLNWLQKKIKEGILKWV